MYSLIATAVSQNILPFLSSQVLPFDNAFIGHSPRMWPSKISLYCLKSQAGFLQPRKRPLLRLEEAQSKLAMLYFANLKLFVTKHDAGSILANETAPYAPKSSNFDSTDVSRNISGTVSLWGCSVHLGGRWYYFVVFRRLWCSPQPDNLFSNEGIRKDSKQAQQTRNPCSHVQTNIDTKIAMSQIPGTPFLTLLVLEQTSWRDGSLKAYFIRYATDLPRYVFSTLMWHWYLLAWSALYGRTLRSSCVLL